VTGNAALACTCMHAGSVCSDQQASSCSECLRLLHMGLRIQLLQKRLLTTLESTQNLSKGSTWDRARNAGSRH
jgi:hypothetical protein